LQNESLTGTITVNSRSLDGSGNLQSASIADL
jgi:hypothetical protein